VRTTLLPLLADRPALGAMGQAAAALGHRHADERLADLVEAAIAGTPPTGSLGRAA
jgi:UDP-N-acetylglucosamine:LPS N-acetylglucosamine transferase